jgi:hypothetical protein
MPGHRLGQDIEINQGIRDPQGRVFWSWGNTIPTSGTAGYAQGCIWQHTDATSDTSALFTNTGTSANCVFTKMATS